MFKRLDDKSLDDLGQLFPIFLVPPKKSWEDWYKEESDKLLSLLPSNCIKRLAHIGSTAVSGIWAKNIIDILLETRSEEDLETVGQQLLENGWRCMSQTATRLSLNKGYTEEGFADKVFHLHIRLAGDHDELYFRDYLNENSSVAKQYESLKLSLWKAFEHDRNGYTDAKTDFIKKYTAIAKEKYRGKYQQS